MNRPSYIDDSFAASGLPVPILALIGHASDPDFPIHVWEPEIGWIVWSNPETN